ncbi:hypothetical protein LAD77_01735 [Klebsiella pneumoniae]|nr:hypothetical protein [Klebsiella pneumoniae]
MIIVAPVPSMGKKDLAMNLVERRRRR